MNRLVYSCFIISFVLSLYLAPIARAQATYTAASCNYSDVNAVINGPTHTAVNGDTINIPAGRCTWNFTLSVTKNISIIGSGTPNTTPDTFGAGTLNTVIVDGISGAGVVQAQINYSAGALFRLSMIDFEPSSTANLQSPIHIAGTCTSSGCPAIRLDNIGLGLTTAWNNSLSNQAQASWLIRVNNAFGVIDHCSENPANAPDFLDPELSSYLGVSNNGDNSWAQPDTMGRANALYVENNVLYTQTAFIDTEVGAAGSIYPGIGGARYVARFNHLTNNGSFGLFGDHGLDTDGRPRGGRQIEVYGNTAQCIGGGSCGALAGWRSATGRVFGNNLTQTGSNFYSIMSASLYRNVYTAKEWGACGGSSPYDVNDTNGGGGNTAYVYYTGTTTSGSSGLTMNDTTKSWTTNQFIPTGAPFSVHNITKGFWAEIASNTATSLTIRPGIPEQTNSFSAGDSYQILRAFVCADQPGRGQGILYSGNAPANPTPASPANQALDPIYEWDNYAPGNLGGTSNVGTSSARLIANRDFFTDNARGNPQAQTSPTSPFNGTSGVGFGTLANRPTTCTTGGGWGVGYFATDQGTWNTSGNNFGQGQLYVCTATNTWTLNYTPYTYPHPLVSGNPVGSANSPNPPVALTATVQ